MAFEVNLDQELKGIFIIEVVFQEALTRFLVERETFTKEEFLEMVRVANQEMKKEGELNGKRNWNN